MEEFEKFQVRFINFDDHLPSWVILNGEGTTLPLDFETPNLYKLEAATM